MKTVPESLYSALSPIVLSTISTFSNLEVLSFDLKHLYLNDPQIKEKDKIKEVIEEFLQENLPKFTKIISLVVMNYQLRWTPGPLVKNTSLENIYLNFSWMQSSII